MGGSRARGGRPARAEGRSVRSRRARWRGGWLGRCRGREVRSEPHRARRVEPRVHRPEIVRDPWPEPHPAEDVPLEVDPRSDLGEDQAVVAEREDGPLRDVADLLPALTRELAVERDLLDTRDELAEGALPDDPDSAVDIKLESLRRQRPDEVDPGRPGTDVWEAARATDTPLECVDVDVALGVDLGERQARDVEPATIVEVEHVRLVDHRLVVETGAALVAGDRHAAQDALLDRQDKLVGDPLLPCHPADELADAEAEVADGAARELEQGAPGDDLAHVERQRWLWPNRPAERPGVVRRVPGDICLPLVRVDVDVVDERPRDLHVSHPQAAARRQLADLSDDDSAAVPGGHGHRQHLRLDRLALHRQVAVLVGGRAANDGEIHREGVEQEPLPAAEGDDLDEVLGRPGVLLAARLARIDVRSKADPRDEAGAPRGDLAHELRQHALGERIRFDLVRLDERPEARLVADVAPDRPSLESGQPELREAAIGEVADADDANGSQVPGVSLFGEDRGQLVDEALRQPVPSPRAPDHDRASVANEPDRLANVDDTGHGM